MLTMRACMPLTRACNWALRAARQFLGADAILSFPDDVDGGAAEESDDESDEDSDAASANVAQPREQRPRGPKTSAYRGVSWQCAPDAMHPLVLHSTDSVSWQ